MAFTTDTMLIRCANTLERYQEFVSVNTTRLSRDEVKEVLLLFCNLCRQKEG